MRLAAVFATLACSALCAISAAQVRQGTTTNVSIGTLSESFSAPEVRLMLQGEVLLPTDEHWTMGSVFMAYPSGFTGGVNVAAGDVNGDGFADVITGSGVGAQPHVKVFDGRTGGLLQSFFAYDPAFTGGVSVAAGDVNGDGFADVITGAGAGAQPHVKVFDGRTGGLLQSFFAFPVSFTGGIRVAAGDVNGDGRADIIAGAKAGAPNGHVKVFDGNTQLELHSFFAFPGFNGGVFVAAGDIDGDGRTEVFVGPDEPYEGFNGPPRIFILLPSSGPAFSSFSFQVFDDDAFAGGVRVGAIDRNGDGRADIMVAPGPGFPAGMHNVRIFDALSQILLDSFLMFPNNPGQGIHIAGARTTKVPPPCMGNANLDTIVNFRDILDVLANFGSDCAAPASD